MLSDLGPDYQPQKDKNKNYFFKNDPDIEEAHHTLEAYKIKNSEEYKYLGLKISSARNFNLAVNELREKACRAFYTIIKQIHVKFHLKSGSNYQANNIVQATNSR